MLVCEVGAMAARQRRFTDRVEAGERLAEVLAARVRPPVVVLAIPRGGVIVGACVADRLDAPMDVVVPRKIGAPGNPELAVGAVAEGVEALDGDAIHRLGLDPAVVIEALSHGAGGSFMFADRGPRMLQAYTGGAEVRSRIDIFVKDMGIVTTVGRTSHVPLPLAAAAVDAVGEHAPERGDDDGRRKQAGCDDAELDGGRPKLHGQPWDGDELHPGADPASQHPVEVDAIAAMTQRDKPLAAHQPRRHGRTATASISKR